jgi:cytochrome c553
MQVFEVAEQSHGMRTTIIYAVTILALLFNAGVTSAEGTAEAADSGVPFDEKVAACAACHGENGAAPILPEYPILAGQYKSYLANALRQYRDGQRTNQIMALQLQVLELTDKDIDQLAAYFASKPSPLHGLGE